MNHPPTLRPRRKRLPIEQLMDGFNFTQRVRGALAGAREEAARLGHPYTGTEHELLGLLLDDSSVAAAVITSFGVQLDDVRRAVEKIAIAAPEPFEPPPDLPFTGRAKKVLELSMDEARLLNHSYVGTQHLLLGLLREKDGIAAQVFASLDITLEATRRRVIEILATGREDDEGYRVRQTRADVAMARANASSRVRMVGHLAPPVPGTTWMAASIIEALLGDPGIAGVFAAQQIHAASLIAALRTASFRKPSGDTPVSSRGEPPPEPSPPTAA